MRIVADTNTFLAVVLGEPERPRLVRATSGARLVGPSILPYELGNALSALVKKNRIKPAQADDAWSALKQVSVELVEVDVGDALRLAVEQNIYAYDAYFLHCAATLKCPLLTLDRSMIRVARSLNLRVLETP